MTESFGVLLRDLRTGARLSLRALGARVHYSAAYLSQLELGQKPPGAEVAARLDAALDADGALVALAAASGDEPRSGHGPRHPAPVVVRPSRGLLDTLTATLALHRRAEDELGPAAMLAPVQAGTATVTALRLAAEGPLHDDAPAATAWYRRALAIAHEVDDACMIASALSMSSNLAAQTGDRRRAASLAAAARRVPAATPGVLVLAGQQCARASAALGDHAGYRAAVADVRRLDDAARARPDREPPWVYFHSEAHRLSAEATGLRDLGDLDAAGRVFEDVLATIAARYSRDRAQYAARLAVTLALAGRPDEARRRLVESRAGAGGSGRTAREIRTAERLLAAPPPR